jgi:hypothetical protein
MERILEKKSSECGMALRLSSEFWARMALKISLTAFSIIIDEASSGLQGEHRWLAHYPWHVKTAENQIQAFKGGREKKLTK